MSVTRGRDYGGEIILSTLFILGGGS